ncbi:heavy-metal-associated domain-containing protein [Actinomyces sp. B33]|uniref:heavy-metal-associated domain-containing protein n=1 Tax=Actinomyces sp. B33 TaxID=2942131 RepID=UPI00233F894F|nr:heavy-metal-associated domain-containing protein [Actinomyces sp. B33]MDC4232348.1 heavy-metal-associated domain-containing protein [Actinomyces sp. B33]
MTTTIDRTIELSVNGMTCDHCVMSVTEELHEIPGVKNIDVILASGGTSTVTVVTDVDLADDALRAAVDEAGFDLVGIARDL